MSGLHSSVLLKLVTVLSFVCIQTSIVNSVPNAVHLSSLIPPPQVLLPPHREEGQPLDDIYLGGGSSIFTSTSATNLKNKARQGNVAQTFVPPSVLPFSPTIKPKPKSTQSSSTEEITIPQIPKHRMPSRKQYTKADLIAAANSLRPAGFDFNKILILKPNSFMNINSTSTKARFLSTSTEKEENNALLPLYEHIMFPLPLLDTPVFNGLRPFMEMLMRESGKLAKSGAVDNKKVLVIVPKALMNVANFGNKLTQQPKVRSSSPKPTREPVTPFRTSYSPQIKYPEGRGVASPKFIIIPKGTSKTVTTSKPKPVQLASTTKRASKFRLGPVKKIERNSSDLQVAATSNKFSQRPEGSSNLAADKRSYSISKGGEKYSFSYAVNNDEIGDVKSHSETRDGKYTAGEYSMLEPDGYTRVVRYTVDSDQGFKASVKRIPPS